MARVWDYFANEGDYPDLDVDGACERLARALAIPTVDGPSREETDWAAFDDLEGHMRSSFPTLFSMAEAEHVDHSLMLTVEGADPELRPVLLLGHMDVVPVVPGTEVDWTWGAFSGHLDDEYVWGRGAIDMTDQLMGNLEALEYLLSHGGRPRRTVIVCMGQDEETEQTGARAMGRELLRRGVRAEFSLDEGGYLVSDLDRLGAPGRHGLMVYLAEKGYADVRLTVRSAGGHSSNPFGGTSLATLARAIARVVENGWPSEMTDLTRQMLEASGGCADVDPEVLRADRELFPYVTTTIAPDIITGSSSQANVMPQDMSATINFRLLEGTTCADVLERVRTLVADLPVEVELIEEVSNDPSHVSALDGVAREALEDACGRYFREPATGEALPLVPSLLLGASDSRMYECVCDACLRFSPFVADDEEVERGVHGTDERITRRAYAQGIRFLIRVLENACR